MNKTAALMLFAVTCGAGYAPCHAMSLVLAPNPNSCDMTTTATVNVTFGGMESDVSVLKSMFDSKIKEIQALGNDLKIAPVLQSMNYNITPQGSDRYGVSSGTEGFHYNGNASFKISPPEKAVDFVAALNKKGFHAGMNMNSYRSGTCNTRSGTDDSHL